MVNQLSRVWAKVQQHRAAQSGNGKAHEQADPHTAAYPAVFLGAEVLSHKGGDRNTQRTHDHPEQTVHLAVSGPGGDGIGTEGVDAGLDNDVGDGEHVALEGSGQAHTQNPAGAVIGEADLTAVHAEYTGAAHEHEHYQHTGYHLRNNGGGGNAQYSHAEAHDEQHVQDDIGQTGDDEEVERTLGIAHRPEDTRSYIIEEGGHHAQGIDPEIEGGIGNDIGGSTHGTEGRVCADEGDYHGDEAAGNGDGNRGVDRLADAAEVPAP